MTNKIGNTIYTDTAQTFGGLPLILTGIILHCNHASNNAIVELGDANTSSTMLKLELPNSEKSKYYNLSGSPINFRSGLEINVLTDAEITLITK